MHLATAPHGAAILLEKSAHRTPHTPVVTAGVGTVSSIKNSVCDFKKHVQHTESCVLEISCSQSTDRLHAWSSRTTVVSSRVLAPPVVTVG
jgi:hypothetical protein